MSKYTAAQIKNWDVDTEAPTGGWIPARPINPTGIITRCRHALGVLTGRYDVLDWKHEARPPRLSNGRSEMTEYYHTLLEKGGRLLKDGEVVQETDYQILGHKKNEAQTPPEKKWIGWKKAQGFPYPTFIRMPEDPGARWESVEGEQN